MGGVGGGGGLGYACLFVFYIFDGCFLIFGGSELVRGWFGTHSFCIRVLLYILVCVCSCVCLPELQSGAECGGVTIVPRVVGRCLPGEPTL